MDQNFQSEITFHICKNIFIYLLFEKLFLIIFFVVILYYFGYNYFFAFVYDIKNNYRIMAGWVLLLRVPFARFEIWSVLKRSWPRKNCPPNRPFITRLHIGLAWQALSTYKCPKDKYKLKGYRTRVVVGYKMGRCGKAIRLNMVPCGSNESRSAVISAILQRWFS